MKRKIKTNMLSETAVIVIYSQVAVQCFRDIQYARSSPIQDNCQYSHLTWVDYVYIDTVINCSSMNILFS